MDRIGSILGRPLPRVDPARVDKARALSRRPDPRLSHVPRVHLDRGGLRVWSTVVSATKRRLEYGLHMHGASMHAGRDSLLHQSLNGLPAADAGRWTLRLGHGEQPTTEDSRLVVDTARCGRDGAARCRPRSYQSVSTVRSTRRNRRYRAPDYATLSAQIDRYECRGACASLASFEFTGDPVRYTSPRPVGLSPWTLCASSRCSALS